MPATLTKQVSEKAFKLPTRMQFREEAPIVFRAPAVEKAGAKTRDFSMTLYSGAPVDIGFGWRMIVDLAGMTVQNKRLPIYANHKPDQLVGQGKATKTAEKLEVEGEAIVALAATKQVIDAIDGGFTYESSMGFSIAKYRFISREDEPESVNGRTFAGPGYIVTKSRLIEGSIVPAGADGDTSTALLSDDGEVVMLDGEPNMGSESKETKDPVAAFAEAHKDAVEKWLADGRKLGADAVTKRFAELHAKFGKERPGFVCEQFAKGNDVAQAAMEFADVVQAELAAEKAKNVELSKKKSADGDGHDGVEFSAKPPTKDDKKSGRKEGETDEQFGARAKQLWEANDGNCQKAFASIEGYKWALENGELEAEAPPTKKDRKAA